MNDRIDAAARLIWTDPATIYQAFVDPASLVRWLPPTGMSGRVETFDVQPGGEYRITLTHDDPAATARGKTTADTDVVHGRFLELVPHRRIVQSVVFESDDPAFAGIMTLRWLIIPEPEGTRVAITAENVPDGISPDDHIAGFEATLANLAAFVERRA